MPRVEMTKTTKIVLYILGGYLVTLLTLLVIRFFVV